MHRRAGQDAGRLSAALVDRLTDAGRWQPGNHDILIVLDAGYEAPRIARLPRDLPVETSAGCAPTRVLRRSTPPPVYQPLGGRPVRHGGEFVLGVDS